MASYYDDNFGHYNIESDEDVAFYREMQRRNVRKRCTRCGQMVSIQPQYAICNSCCEAAERGQEY